MNSCILMAEIIKDPELRYTTDNKPLAEMLVQFPGVRPEEPPATLKVVGWGNLASEIKERYHRGDRIIIEGRLSMNTIERPEGFKEKRAELTASRIHRVGADADFGQLATASSAEDTNNIVVPFEPRRTPAATVSSEAEVGMNFGGSQFDSQTSAPKFQPTPAKTPATATPNFGNDLDDIPF